ncbi:trypsin-1 isoform X2 [Halyomorpha halys]
MNHRRLVFANPEYNQDGYSFLSSLKDRYYRTDLYENPTTSCNCSWGTVPDSERIVRTKIVGGHVVKGKENYPFMVGIQDNIEECVFCGGSIITEYHVLTAAHCVYGEQISDISLAFGVKDRCRDPSSDGQYIPILETVYIHEYYFAAPNHNDIAIILPSRKIIFNNKVGPACIYNKPVEDNSASILILGWGRVAETSGASPKLLKVFVKYVDTRVCRTKLPSDYINNNLRLQMCTYAEKKDACGGDSGGPLFIVDSRIQRLSQVALVSMGKGCARYGIPAVNTALYPYIGWIQWTVENSMRKHFPQDYRTCGHSLCYGTTD